MAGDRNTSEATHGVRDRNTLEARNRYGDQVKKETSEITEDKIKTKRYKYNDKGEIIDLHNRLIVPLVKVKEIIEANHDHMLAGHLGIAKTLARIKRQYKWPQMKQHVVLHVNSCLLCARRKSFGTTKAPLKPLPPVESVWERIAMDVVGPIQESNKGYRYILVISDYASRFVFTIPMKNQTAQTIARCLVNKIITKYGAPQHVLTDRGTNFLSSLVNEICVLFKIKQMRTTAYHPQTDGLVERFNRTLCDMLACYVHDEPEEWDKYLPFVTFAYNTAIQSTLKECPFYLFFGRAPLLPNDIKINSRYDTRHDDRIVYAEKWENAKKLARNHLFKAQTKQKEYYDKGTKTCVYSVGQTVLVKAPPTAGKFINRWNGPFVITRSFSNVNYEIESIPKSKQRRAIVHVNRLKPYTARAPEIPPNAQRERMTEPNKTEPITFGIPPHAETFNQPVKRGRGRPRKTNPAPKTIPTGVPSRRTPPHQNNIHQDTSRRSETPEINYAHLTQRRNNNYPNTRSTKSHTQWRPQQSSTHPKIPPPEYRPIFTERVTQREVPDFPVTRDGHGRLIHHIPVAHPSRPYFYNQRQREVSTYDDSPYNHNESQDKSPLRQTRYNLRRRY
jgi:transposase InsO family protein